MNSNYKVAIACWAVPLIVGLSVFFIWEQTDYSPLMGVGVATLIAGVFLFFVGAYSLIRGHFFARESMDESNSNPWQWTLPISVLLLSNFLVAGVVVLAAIEVHTSYRLEIKNDSDSEVVDCQVQVNGRGPSFGSIRPRSVARKRFDAPGEGELVLKGKWNGQAIEHTVDGYVTSSLGGNKTVIFNKDGTVTTADHRK